MANPEIKKYTVEQWFRLAQFARGVTILKSLQKDEQDILEGREVFLKGDDGSSLVCGIGHLRIFQGALTGMFNEIMDLGLKDEIRLIMENKK